VDFKQALADITDLYTKLEWDLPEFGGGAGNMGILWGFGEALVADRRGEGKGEEGIGIFASCPPEVAYAILCYDMLLRLASIGKLFSLKLEFVRRLIKSPNDTDPQEVWCASAQVLGKHSGVEYRAHGIQIHLPLIELIEDALNVR